MTANQIIELKAEVARLTEERDAAITHVGEEARLRGLAEAEVARLTGLLAEKEATK